MAQKTSWTGGGITESDINTYLAGEGGAWTSWTPTCQQSFAVSLSVTQARYGRWGRKIEFYAFGTFTSNGATSNEVIFSLPVTAATSGFVINSHGYINDGSQVYAGGIWLKSTTTCGILGTGSNGALLGASVMTSAVISGDSWSIAGTYEAAT